MERPIMINTIVYFRGKCSIKNGTYSKLKTLIIKDLNQNTETENGYLTMNYDDRKEKKL
ncbi:hypothetical protein GCM10017764_23420 [Sphingobacterium griseoflavum]|uniref:Uncharacterized protein n=1 Tax=Sphingobacterium griseoflavum TaxID=1474952 RepID=A0ABQ3HW35_9SPHI|nr:hypothetical protein GCM10017764_23420 [Sphingobacterium griseoflavum]